LHPESNENPNQSQEKRSLCAQHCGLDQPPKFKFKSLEQAQEEVGDDLEDQGLRVIDSSFAIRERVKPPE
jgi:hypothetical protein